MNTKTIYSMSTALALIVSMVLAVPAFAATTNGAGVTDKTSLSGMMRGRGNGYVGPGKAGGNQSRGLGDKFIKNGKLAMATSTVPTTVGNGQPVVAGTVSVISSSTITVTTASNVTYTVDASSAKFIKGSGTATLSNVVVGDKVMVQGTVNGTSVTASTVIDQSVLANGAKAPQKSIGVGFFGGIGRFFMSIFGF